MRIKVIDLKNVILFETEIADISIINSETIFYRVV